MLEIDFVSLKSGWLLHIQRKIVQFDPLNIGIKRYMLEELKGGGLEENAKKLRDILIGGDYINTKRNVIILNDSNGYYVYRLSKLIEKSCKQIKHRNK